MFRFIVVVFLIFELMRGTAKQVSFLIFALILNLVWVNSRFDKASCFQNNICLCNDCQDTSDPSVYLDSICCEDDVFLNDSIVKSENIEIINDKVLLSKVFILKDHLNKIWQPPKFIL
jgi:hypothetical protein